MIFLSAPLLRSYHLNSQMADFTVELILKRSKRFKGDDKLGRFLVHATQLISSEQNGICGMYLHPLSLFDIVISSFEWQKKYMNCQNPINILLFRWPSHSRAYRFLQQFNSTQGPVLYSSFRCTRPSPMVI